jgi:hypothetical protein
VSNCSTEADVTACSNKKIAEWTVANLNSELTEKSVILVTEAPLVRPDGTPVKDKSGAQIVKKASECDNMTGFEQETCMEVFLYASNCKINPPEDGNVDACVQEKIGEWVDSNMSEE